MTISGLPGLPLNNLSISQRPAAGGARGAVAGPGDTETSTQAESRRPQREAVELNPPSQQRAIEPSSRQKEIFSRQSPLEDPLNYKSQKALQAFADNSPSPSQQLGIELAGIDTYV